jgi:hypothetical protein
MPTFMKSRRDAGVCNPNPQFRKLCRVVAFRARGECHSYHRLPVGPTRWADGPLVDLPRGSRRVGLTFFLETFFVNELMGNSERIGWLMHASN